MVLASFPHNTDEAARFLLGKIVMRSLADGMMLSGRICETESYTQDDPASHSFCGQTERNSVMFGPPFKAYIYQIYGIHFCLNVVTSSTGEGNAVLIREIKPIDGLKKMLQFRGVSGWSDKRVRNELLNGPGKICQALNIDLSLNGHDYRKMPLQIIDDGCVIPDDEIKLTPRIGISKGTDRLRRFIWKIDNQAEKI